MFITCSRNNANEVCEESSRFSRGNRKAYHMIKVAAHREGKTLHEKLAEFGATGIQGPTFYNYDTGQSHGTVRLHDTTLTQAQLEGMGRTKGANMINKKTSHFNSQTGKQNIQKHETTNGVGPTQQIDMSTFFSEFTALFLLRASILSPKWVL